MIYFCAGIYSIYTGKPDPSDKEFMLNLAEHEILYAHKYKQYQVIKYFQDQISLECYFSCS